MVNFGSGVFKSLSSTSSSNARSYKRGNQGDLCYEFLKFSACSVQAKFGQHYAHSIYESRKYTYDHKNDVQLGFSNIWASNPDEPLEVK